MSQNPSLTRRRRPFTQVDVFTDEPYRGNPLAVVLDAVGLSTEHMQRFANWTNLAETTFLLPPTHPDAQWLIGSGRAPSSYTAAQGTVLAARPRKCWRRRHLGWRQFRHVHQRHSAALAAVE